MSRLNTTWVVKAGSALLADTQNPNGIDMQCVQNLTRGVLHLREMGVQTVLVSSGAVACGMPLLGLRERPRKLELQQAAAAVGQSVLMHTYRTAFAPHQVAQLLLTPTDRDDRERYLNIRGTLDSLLRRGIIPIVNENDTVTTDELRFGDNDQLAAMVADLAGASRLALLTDRDGLYSTDPGKDPNARLIENAVAGDPSLDGMALPGDTRIGRGGMYTKLRAARQASLAGIVTYIGNGNDPDILQKMWDEAPGFTRIRGEQRIVARKRWLASASGGDGILHLDAGASRQLLTGGASLLVQGISKISGTFNAGDIVHCHDSDNKLIARGRVSHSSDTLKHALREGSLGLVPAETIHRDNLVLLNN